MLILTFVSANRETRLGSKLGRCESFTTMAQLHGACTFTPQNGAHWNEDFSKASPSFGSTLFFLLVPFSSEPLIQFSGKSFGHLDRDWRALSKGKRTITFVASSEKYLKIWSFWKRSGWKNASILIGVKANTHNQSLAKHAVNQSCPCPTI